MSRRSRGDDQPAGSEQPLDRQLGRAAIRSQRLFNRSFERLSELEALLLGLIDSLVARGVVDESDVRAMSERMAAELGERDDAAPHAVDLRTDDPAGRPELVVDCAQRMPVCRAVCCKLAVTLSAPEVEGGQLRWDLGRPYQLRREKAGWCSHNERETGRCTVYADRPGPCRQYSCATDGRIWKDFEAMELNHEWVDAHVGHDEPRLIPVESLRRRAG